MPEQPPNLNNDIIERQIKIVSAMYDKAVAYTNVIVIAGYAGFFGLWALTKQYLTSTQARLAALFMLASICAFVFFEVYKMVVSTRELLYRAKMFNDPLVKNDPIIFSEKLREYEQNEKRHNVSFIWIWRIQIIIAVATALIAIGILGFSFVCGLIETT
ncbi:MAG TPA: hypothetical protein VK440_07510 [Burkholderiales bacterium]|nr:hypothetical protein [Burkholderiales bacterium]